MSFKTIAGGFTVLSDGMGPLSEDQENFEQIYQNYLVALNDAIKQCVIDFFFSCKCNSD